MKQKKRIYKNIGGWVCFVFLGLLLNSCSLKKQPEHKAIVTDAFKDSTAIPDQWTTKTDTNKVNNSWVESFNDPMLDSIVAEAIRNNFDLKNAAGYVEIAQQNVLLIASKMKPQVGLSFGYDATIDNKHSSLYNSYKGFSIASWEPDVWGEIRSQKAGATAQYEATALNYEYAKQSLAAVTAKSWYLTVESSKIVALYQEVVTIYTEILELVKTRRSLGKVGDLDVAEASANLNAAQNVLLQSQGIFAETKRNLETLVGRYPSAEIQTAKNFSPVPPPIQAGLPSQLLERRPDIVAAEKNVIAAFRDEEAQKLALLPSFKFNIGTGLLSDVLLSVSHLNPLLLTGGIGMTVPIYTGGRLPALIKIANIQQQQAVSNYGSVCLNAFKEVENGIMYEDILAKQIIFQQNVIANRSEAVKIAKSKYELGKMDLLPVLQLQNDLIASQEELIKLQNAQLSNRINLHLALGGNF